jgi:hypothetical protein
MAEIRVYMDTACFGSSTADQSSQKPDEKSRQEQTENKLDKQVFSSYWQKWLEESAKSLPETNR